MKSKLCTAIFLASLTISMVPLTANADMNEMGRCILASPPGERGSEGQGETIVCIPKTLTTREEINSYLKDYFNK